jgi:hypothetical protein
MFQATATIAHLGERKDDVGLLLLGGVTANLTGR